MTVSAPDDSDQTMLQCDVIRILNQVMSVMDDNDIDGLTSVSFEPIAIPSACSVEDPNVTAEKSVSDSQQVPAGMVVGAALGGMCLVLLALLVVRQRLVKKRGDSGTVMTKDTKTVDGSALEMTVDANETQQSTSRYLSPKATMSNDSTILGISASPDDCSEWGDGKGPSKIDHDDVESLSHPQTKTDPDPSDISFDDSQTEGSVRSAAYVSPPAYDSPDPPSAAPEAIPFQPNVREEESMMHDVDLMHDNDDDVRDGLCEA